MSIASTKLTLQEYLNRHDEGEQHYELEAGNLSEMPPESPINAEIAIKLLLIFAQFVPTPRCLRCKDTEIVVSGSRTTVRLPDLMVLTEELADILYDSRRSTIMSDMPPPALVVEVVSPGKVNQDRDYRFKRSEYAARGIAEYWIVDPQLSQVMVLALKQGFYDEAVFVESDAVKSPFFPQLQLAANQIFSN
ncbi:MAG: Uma2 family endonuclease [Cyanobacteria bacterium J06621_8]